MEIRCSQCQHVGAAREIRPTDSGVMLICANCGHGNALELDASTPAPPAKAPVLPAPADLSGESAWLKPGALERLIPAAGSGPRCRKCVQLLDEEESHCPRCGLGVDEAAQFAEGTAPWEKPPLDRELQHEQATLLWSSVDENPTDENLEKFARFVQEEQLLEYGIQRVRHFLVVHPGHESATSHLQVLAQSFQSKMIIAQARAQVRAGNIMSRTGQMKGVLLWVVFAIWAAVLLLFLSQMGGV